MMPKFIAEVSSNHQQDLDRCIEFINVASQVGCDAVKFQLFKVENLFAPEILLKSPKHWSRKQWELPPEYVPELAAHCKLKNIEFSCTPFDLQSVDLLAEYVSFFKIASYELLWHDLLRKCINTSKPVVLSTGMATLDEIICSVNVLDACEKENLSLLHCVSSYPTPVAECNLSAIKTIRDLTQCSVGWSDHSASPAVLYQAALKWNASIIEFHLDLEGKGSEFNSGHCWLPEQIKDVINTINLALLSDGSGQKYPTDSELSDRDWRADPSDGLRPLKHLRGTWQPD